MEGCEEVYRYHFIKILFLVYKCCENTVYEHPLMCVKTVLCVYYTDGRQLTPVPFSFLSLRVPERRHPHMAVDIPALVCKLYKHGHTPLPTNSPGSEVGDTEKGSLQSLVM